MNKTKITTELKMHGIPGMNIQYGWLRSDGLGIHIVDTTFYALLPLDDASDMAFVDFICAEVAEEVSYAITKR